MAKVAGDDGIARDRSPAESFFVVLNPDREAARLTARQVAQWLPTSRHAVVWQAQQLAELLQGEQPNLAITELNLPGQHGDQLVPLIRRRWPECRLLAYSDTNDPERAAAAIQHGADAFLTRDSQRSARLHAAVQDLLGRERGEERNWKRRYVRLVRTLENLPRGLGLFGRSERLSLFNPSLPRMLPLATEEVAVGLTLESLLRACAASGQVTDALENHSAWTRRGLAELRIEAGVWLLSLADGRRLQLDSHQVGTGGLLLMISDITGRARLERALADSERRFRDFAEAASDWLWETDDQFRFTFVSDRAQDSVGDGFREILGRTRWELARVDPETDSLWRSHLDDLQARRPFRDFRYRPWVSGRQAELRISGVPVFRAAGRFRGYRGTATDESAQKSAERRADDAEVRLQTVAENMPGAIYQRVLASDGSVTFPYLSPGIEALTGYTPAQISLRPELFIGAIHPDDVVEFRQRLAQSANTLAPMDIQVRLHRRQGDLIWVRMISRPRRSSDDSVIWESLCIDATDQRRLEEGFRQLVEVAPMALLVVDRDGSVTLANAHAEILFGCSRNAIVGHSVEELMPESARVAHWAYRSRYLRNALPVPMEVGRRIYARRADGSEIEVEAALAPVDFPGGPHTLVFLTDLTQRRQQEQQWLHIQKLESIGQLASGIAHEINTPSQYVTDNLQFLRDAFADLLMLQQAQQVLRQEAELGAVSAETLQGVDSALLQADMEYLLEQIPRALTQSVEGMQRVAHIVGAMKEFSHPGGAEMTPVDLARLVENAITVARNEWKYSAEVTTDFDPGLPLVPCYSDELGQVVLNLVVNAAHAIADKVIEDKAMGHIGIGVARAGDWVEIRISDDGKGIPESIRHRVFDPFFTTKSVGKGTGQGLAIAHAVVVQKHHGSIELRSVEGEGTTFVIRIPIEPPAATAVDTGEETP